MKPEDFSLERYVTNLKDVPIVKGLREEEGWVDMQVQFLINKQNANSKNFLLGWTVLPPGARHDKHKHFHADEFWIVLSGSGIMYTEDGEKDAAEGDVVLTPRGQWHGFNNTTKKDVTLVWGWSGSGSIEDAGYEVDLNK